MTPGDEYVVSGYRYRFDGVEDRDGPNYQAEFGTITVFHNEVEVARLHPEKRFYLRQSNAMTEAGIDAGLFRYLYVALGEPLNENGSWSVRLYYNAFVRWIWLGPLFMALGGLIAVSDRRYRRFVPKRNGIALPDTATSAG